MRKLYDAVLTAVLAIVVVELGLSIVCILRPFDVSCDSSTYVVLMLVALTLLAGLFLKAQYAKTITHFQKRIRSNPLPASLALKLTKTFDSVADMLWIVYDIEGVAKRTKLLNRPTPNKGWVITYTSGYKIVVYEQEFYYWLLKVANLQKEWEKAGVLRLKSPISQREAGLTRATWLAYRRLLADVKAVKQLNGNVIVLRKWAVYNPYSVVEQISEIRQLIEV